MSNQWKLSTHEVSLLHVSWRFNWLKKKRLFLYYWLSIICETERKLKRTKPHIFVCCLFSRNQSDLWNYPCYWLFLTHFSAGSLNFFSHFYHCSCIPMQREDIGFHDIDQSHMRSCLFWSRRLFSQRFLQIYHSLRRLHFWGQSGLVLARRSIFISQFQADSERYVDLIQCVQSYLVSLFSLV